MAQTLREADEIEAARVASGKVVFVGYMRRYATAFLRVKTIIKELDPSEINYGEAGSLRTMLTFSPHPKFHVAGERLFAFATNKSQVPDGIISQNGTFPRRFSGEHRDNVCRMLTKPRHSARSFRT
jgi:hypothetical protein